MNPSPDQIRSRQTASLATEHWWRSRVEALAAKWRDPEFWEDVGSRWDSTDCARELEALIAERNPR